MLDRPPPRGDPSPRPVPPELESLHRELARLRIQERPSFAPELEAELRAAWREACRRGGLRRRTFRKRALWVAGFGALVVAAVAVPSARAAVIRTASSLFQGAAAVVRASPSPPRPSGPWETPRVPTPSLAGGFAGSPSPDPDRVSGKGSVLQPPRYSFPELADPEEARTIIASHYPEALQKAGIGGAVTLWFWLTPEGRPENIQVRRGSGYQSLDDAAMLALRKLRFRAATRNGAPVGTWVEFTVRFEADGNREDLVLEAVQAAGTPRF